MAISTKASVRSNFHEIVAVVGAAGEGSGKQGNEKDGESLPYEEDVVVECLP